MNKTKLISNIQFVKRAGFFYCFYKYLGSKGYCNNVPDATYLNRLAKLFFHRKIDLDNPKTYSEKLQWLKINDHNPRYTELSDKYEVKKVVSEVIGNEHIIPCIGVWDKAENIDFDSLPDSFVLKATHDSGGLVVVKDKNTIDKQQVINYLNGRLSRNFFWAGREWNYKNIKPRVIAEPYIESLGKSNSIEYKVTCFNGVVEFITVCRGIAHSRFDYRNNDFYDRNFNKLNMVTNYYANSGQENIAPACLDEIIVASERLAKDIPVVRVDFYVDNDKFIFGEMTFYTWSGFFRFTPNELDRKLGDKISLPEKTR